MHSISQEFSLYEAVNSRG